MGHGPVRIWPVAFTAGAWLFLCGVVLQVFLAGLAAFDVTDWAVHADLGWWLPLGPLILLGLAILARVERRTRWLTVLLAISAVVQPELAEARIVAPVLAALHPVNAVVVFWLAWLVARASLAAARPPVSRPDRDSDL